MKPSGLFAVYKNATKDTGKDCPKCKTKVMIFSEDTTVYYDKKTYEVSAGKGIKLLVKRKGMVYASTSPSEIKSL